MYAAEPIAITGRRRTDSARAKEMAAELLRRGHAVTDVSRATHLHRVTVQKLKGDLGLTSPAERLAHTQAQLDVQTEISELLQEQIDGLVQHIETVEEENGQLAFALVMTCSELATERAKPRRSRPAPANARIAELTKELARTQADLRRTYARERRKDQELRDARKDSTWAKLANEIAFSVLDVLPESVWWRLLEDETVVATFTHPRLDAVDRRAELVLTDQMREALRDVINLRQTLELDDENGLDKHKRPFSQSAKARRERFSRAWRTELYGEE